MNEAAKPKENLEEKVIADLVEILKIPIVDIPDTVRSLLAVCQATNRFLLATARNDRTENHLVLLSYMLNNLGLLKPTTES